MAWFRQWQENGEDELLQARLRRAYSWARDAGLGRNALAVDQSLPGWQADPRLFQGARIIWDTRPFS